MTITADVYEIAVLLAALAFIVLVAALVPTVLQVRRTVKALEDLSTESKRMVESLNHIFKKTGDQAGDIEELVKRFKDVGLKIAGLADTVIDNIKSPLITVISLILGLEEGLKGFCRSEKKGGGDHDNQ
jgi:uncharacterized protein YoxC